MINFIKENAASVLICIVLAVIVTLIIIKLVKDKRNGKCSCGCESCSKNCNKRQ